MYNQPTYSRTNKTNLHLQDLSKSSFYLKTLPPLPNIDWKLPKPSHKPKPSTHPPKHKSTQEPHKPKPDDDLDKFYQQKSKLFQDIENYNLTTAHKRKAEDTKVASTRKRRKVRGTTPQSGLKGADLPRRALKKALSPISPNIQSPVSGSPICSPKDLQFIEKYLNPSSSPSIYSKLPGSPNPITPSPSLSPRGALQKSSLTANGQKAQSPPKPFTLHLESPALVDESPRINVRSPSVSPRRLGESPRSPLLSPSPGLSPSPEVLVPTITISPNLSPVPSPAKPLPSTPNRTTPALLPKPSPLTISSTKPLSPSKEVIIRELCFSPFQYSKQTQTPQYKLLSAFAHSDRSTSQYFGTCPPEIITTILSFLESSVDLCSVACISKQWLYLSSSSAIWQPLYILNFSLPAVSPSTPLTSKTNWKAMFLKRRKEIVVKKVKAYGKKTRLTTNFEFGLSESVTYPSALPEESCSAFKIPTKKARKPRKKQTKADERSQNEDPQLIQFLQKKKQFYDSFDNVSLLTTPSPLHGHHTCLVCIIPSPLYSVNAKGSLQGEGVGGKGVTWMADWYVWLA
eukprot:TRINITY_DN3080_c0_g1_i2.p1 TRINITY_DN3080_c0_g1~~TRINITY_DN3080_c0_g1_i2.p1  ORF type:complete len:588 (-),score=171.99 TRINITY_DN3080_c0_g1_i2:285-1997(-)